MPLANISSEPDKAHQSAYDFAHWQDHLEIIRAAKAVRSITLNTAAIFPVIKKDSSWKRRHQSLHDNMNSALGTSGADLTGNMDKSWYDQNYREHSAARSVLGI